MEKLNRSERLVLMMRVLTERPGELIPLHFFTDRFDSAKSTVSEDLALIKEALERSGSGLLRTHAGAIGGVQYWPIPSATETQETLQQLSELLSDPARILPGGFVYLTDILTNPAWSSRIGAIFAARFLAAEPDVVLTVETKGIPLGQMVARAMGIPMAFARREGRVTDGPSLTIHYISGSAQRINTMAVGVRALRQNARVLVVDDFMRAGATARAMVDLVTERGAAVVGVGILVTTAEPQRKRVDDYVSLLTIESVNGDERSVYIRPSL